MSYKLHPNKKTRWFSKHPPIKEKRKMHKWLVWEDRITGRAPSRFESLAQQPETCFTTSGPITPSPAAPSPCSWALWTKTDPGTEVTSLGRDKGVFCNMQMAFNPHHGSPLALRCNSQRAGAHSPLPAAPQDLPGTTQAGPQTALTLTAARHSRDSSNLHRSS